MIAPTSPNKLRPLAPRKLFPPADVIAHRKEKKKKQLLKNPVLKFFYVFFGEGF